MKQQRNSLFSFPNHYLDTLKLTMKPFVLFLTLFILLISCKKSNSDDATVQYQFTSDVSAAYKMEYGDADMVHTETFQGTSWSKTVILKRDPAVGNIRIARLVAYPPSNWGSTDKAHVNIKILVDGSVKVDKDTLMTTSNTGPGIFEIYSF
jgi:hypothetical protein